MAGLNDNTVLHRPHVHQFERDGLHVLIDGDRPNWVATDWRGALLCTLIDGRRTLKDLVRVYGEAVKVEPFKAWVHVRRFIQAAVRHEMVSLAPITAAPYTGRASYLSPTTLREFWVHTNNSCNLTCSHCLVSSHPGGEPGLPTDHLIRLLKDAWALGASRFYFTGGEPFLRKDLFNLIACVTNDFEAELIILTNATLFRGTTREQLSGLDRRRLKFQISLDGTTPEINDPIRGKKTFDAITQGAQTLAALGFDISLTAVMTATNLSDIAKLPALAERLGVKSLHLMWMHHRGRILEQPDSAFPTPQELLETVRAVKRESDSRGITVDNYESLKLRVNGKPGTKFDLSNACWDSLCLGSNGHVYPSASFSGHVSMDLGDTAETPLRAIWLDHPLAKTIRAASIVNKRKLATDPFRFMIGGGDIEHSYFFSDTGTHSEHLLAEDPYYELYVNLAKDIMIDLSESRRQAFNTKSGFDGPVLFQVMGEGMDLCGSYVEDTPVSTLHSNCVLAFNVETPHQIVQAFYGQAAETPKPELCCPNGTYTAEDLAHVPKEVLDRSYGCGSPMQVADVREGETVVDLGSGGGIDCFVAARKTGPAGKVVGVDMTDQMLAVAERNRSSVADSLGYDVVEFRKGYLERIPVPTTTADLVTSNCVINLSPNKKAVFAEIWRILNDGGRTVISDIVSERPVPPSIRVNDQLWGECIAGALTEEEIIAYLEEAGFYGIELLQKVWYRDVEGYRFSAITVRGYKLERTPDSSFNGYLAMYRGPMKMVLDEDGQLFPRGEAVPVTEFTAAKLRQLPYVNLFTVIPPNHARIEIPPTAQRSDCRPIEPSDAPRCC